MFTTQLAYKENRMALIPQIPISSASAEPTEQLERLVYELLDAHADTERLVHGTSTHLRWQAHLHYLRDLQRTGREILARADNT
jgi:hypothetical protein